MKAFLKGTMGRMPFWQRILLLVVVTIFIFSLTAFLLFSAVTRVILLGNAQEDYQALNRQIINSVDNSFKTVSNAAIASMYNNSMQMYIYKSQTGNISTAELSAMSTLIESELRMLYHTFTDMQIFVIIPDSQLIYNHIYGTGNYCNTEYEYKTDDWYAAAVKSGEIRTFVLNNPQRYYVHGKPCHTMVLAVPFGNVNFHDKMAAYVLVDFSPDIFERYIETSPLDVYGTLILTQDDQIVYSSVADFSERFALGEVPAGGSGTQMLRVNGQECIAVYDTDPFTSWRIVTLVRTDRIMGQVSALNGVWFLLTVLAFLGMLPLLYRLSRRMTTSLRVLSEAMGSVRAGSLSTRVGLEGEDEFAHLGRDLNRMLDQIMELMQQKETLAALNKQTELSALQQQVNPHFLYNTLGMIIGLASSHEEERIITICESMGTLMRYATGYEKKVTFFAEMQYVNAYLAVAAMRYEGLFQVECACDPQLSDVLVLKMCLQPLVENAVIHGFAEHRRRGTLEVECTLQGEMVCLRVEDDGIGMDAHTLRRLRLSLEDDGPFDKQAAHIGVRNVWMRLKLTYGVRATLRIDSIQQQGTCVTVSFPMEK